MLQNSGFFLIPLISDVFNSVELIKQHGVKLKSSAKNGLTAMVSINPSKLTYAITAKLSSQNLLMMKIEFCLPLLSVVDVLFVTDDTYYFRRYGTVDRQGTFNNPEPHPIENK